MAGQLTQAEFEAIERRIRSTAPQNILPAVLEQRVLDAARREVESREAREKSTLSRTEFEMLEQQIRARPSARNLSNEQIERVILEEAARVRDSRGAKAPSFLGSFSERPQRMVPAAEYERIQAQVKAAAPEGVSPQELHNLTMNALHSAEYEAQPPSALSQTATQLLSSVLPEHPIEFLPGHLQQMYRDAKRNEAKASDYFSPEWAPTAQHIKDTTNADLLKLYQLGRGFVTPVDMASFGAGRVAAPLLVKGIKAARGADKASDVGKAVRLRVVDPKAARYTGAATPTPGVAEEVVEEAAAEVPRAYKTFEGPAAATPATAKPYTPTIERPPVEEAVEAAATTPAGQRAYRVEGPSARDLRNQPTEGQQAVDSFFDEAAGGTSEGLGAAEEAVTPLDLRSAPEAAQEGAEGLTEALSGEVVDLPGRSHLVQERLMRGEGGSTPGLGGSAKSPEVVRLQGEGQGLAGATEELPEGIEEVIKTRTRPGAPGSEGKPSAGRVAGFEKLPLISEGEGARIGGNIQAIQARRKGGREATSWQYDPANKPPRPEILDDLEEEYPILASALRQGVGSEAGFSGLGLTRALTGGVGAAGGAAAGANAASEGNELPGALVGGVLGGLFGQQIPREAQLFGQEPLQYIDRAMRGSMLAGAAPLKSGLSAATSVPIKLAEQTLYGYPVEAGKNLFRSLKSLPKGAKRAGHVAWTGESPAYMHIPEVHRPPAKGLFSIPGRTMGLADAPAREAQMAMFDPITQRFGTSEDAATELLSGASKTEPGQAFLEMLAGHSQDPKWKKWGPVGRHFLFPLGAPTSVNVVEQGLQRLPFGLNLGTELAARKVGGLEGLKQSGRELFGNTVLGTAAFGAGNVAEEQFDPESRKARGVASAAFGKYALPFTLGTLWQRNQELDEANRISAPEVLAEGLQQESPFRGVPQFNATDVAKYLGRWVPAFAK